jgi:hypothetical protein
MRSLLAASLALGTLVGAADASAHFYLQQPPALSEQDAYGDPQKVPPCGGGGVPTGIVTPFQAGSTITITIDETVFHPGHYRVALAVNSMSELPDAPPVTPGNTDCGSVPILDPPMYPVLADGMLEHTSPFGGPQSFEVTLPESVLCDGCTLQILEFMSDHAAPCFYHHCATISIQEEPVMTTSTSASSGAGSGGTGGGGGTGAGGPNLENNPREVEESGCSIGPSRGAGVGPWIVALLGLVVAARRRG